MHGADALRRHGIGDLVRRSAKRYPKKLALAFGDRRWTFSELDLMVNRAANWFVAHKIAAGNRVAILSRNTDTFVIAYLALARLGAVSVPVNFMLGAEEIAYILAHSGAEAILAQDALTSVAEQAIGIVGRDLIKFCSIENGGEKAGWIDVRGWDCWPNADEPSNSLGDDDVVQLMYTSGTESKPKGAMMTSRSLIAQYVSVIVGGEMTTSDVEVHALPLYHCAQLHCFLTPALYLGSTSIVLKGPEPRLLLQTIERERVTKMFAPPTVWISLLRQPDFDQRDLSSLRKAYYGAASMPVEVLKELGERLPGLRLFNFYGQTEMSPNAAILGPDDHARKAGSAGLPSLNVETQIVDDLGRAVPSGIVGEVVHRSPQTMAGYWEANEQTKESFRDGWFHSGDLGVMDDEGFLTIVDRKKDMIKTGGENVASREVEEVLHEHAAVAEAAVFGVPHPYWIEAIVAAVTLRGDQEASAEELLAFCRKRLAGFKTPKHIVVLSTLPKNPSGKILKRELRAGHARFFEKDPEPALRRAPSGADSGL
jgi:fatty-acyl-CoA synthase